MSLNDISASTSSSSTVSSAGNSNGTSIGNPAGNSTSNPAGNSIGIGNLVYPNTNMDRFFANANRAPSGRDTQMSESFRAHIASTAEKLKVARISLAKLHKMLTEDGETTKAAKINDLAKKVFDNAWATTDVAGAAAIAGDTLYHCTTIAMAHAWIAVVKTDEEAAAEEIAKMGKELFGDEVFSAAMARAVENV